MHADDRSTPSAAEPSVRPVPRVFRWVVLVAMSLVCFAQYYIYDSITPLAGMIKEELGFSGAAYGLLFSFYSVANVFFLMLLLAGVLVDRLGLKLSGVMFCVLCVLGALLTAVGAWPGLRELLGPAYGLLENTFPAQWSPELKIMLLGRMIYGVGAEAILVVNNKVLARWFRGHELAFAYGANLTVMRLGTFLAEIVQAPVAVRWGLQPALWLAAAIMTGGLAVFFVYLLLERLGRGRPGAPKERDTPREDEKVRLRDVFSFGAPFWFITLVCVAFYSAIFPFQSYAPDILVHKFGYSITTAARYASVLILGTMIFTPIFGWIIDRKGKRASLMILGSLLLVPSLLLIGYTRVTPALPMFMVGVAFSLVPAALWASIPMIVPERRLGTAFGVVGYVQNVGLLAFPYVAGRIADAHTTRTVTGGNIVDYTWTMLLFVGLGTIGLVFAILLKWADARRKDGGSLEQPSIAPEAPA